MSDRIVHASFPGLGEVVRYDREGRWYYEGTGKRERLKTVHDAAAKAIELEQRGGTIHLGRAGGKQFDHKVAGCRRKTGAKP